MDIDSTKKSEQNYIILTVTELLNPIVALMIFSKIPNKKEKILNKKEKIQIDDWVIVKLSSNK